MKSQEKVIKNALGKLIKQSIKQSTQREMLALPSDQQQSGQNLEGEHPNQALSEQKKQMHILIKIMIFLVIVGLLTFTIISISSSDNKNKPIKASLHQFFQRAYDQAKQNIPQQYIDVGKSKPYSQLPFCIIIKPSLNQGLRLKISESIKNQKYTNYKVLNTKDIQNKFTYKHLLGKVRLECSQYSILLFIDQVLSAMALNAYNILYQKHNMWVSYALSNYDIIYENSFKQQQEQNIEVLKKETVIQITSMYMRIFQLIQKNDFYGFHQQYFQQNFDDPKIRMILMTSIFELCRFNSMHVSLQILQVSSEIKNQNEKFLFSKIQKQVKSVLKTQHKKISQNQQQKNELVSRIPYQTLFSLSQQYQININQFLRNRYHFYKNSQNFQTSYWKKNEIHPKQIKQASQIEQIPHLSPNHSLFTIDKIRMEQKYKTSSHLKNQLPLCVCVFSYNYENNDRYRRALKSISMQKYQNYHIVFFDDFSQDETFQKTVQYLKQLKFKKDKITLIRNSVRKHQTYNILNAAFNYCKDNQIQVVIDGDDQLIGQYVFQFINSQYHNTSLWLMHNLDKNQRFQEGENIPWSDDYIYTFLGRRRWKNFFSPLRTWLVKLIRRLPAGQHKTPLSDNFFDSNYNIGLQYGLREMAGQNHSKYIPQINYLSTCYQIDNRKEDLYQKIRGGIIHFLVSMRNTVKTAYILDQSSDSSLIKQILNKGKNVQYKKVQYQP